MESFRGWRAEVEDSGGGKSTLYTLLYIQLSAFAFVSQIEAEETDLQRNTHPFNLHTYYIIPVPRMRDNIDHFKRV